uniref:putative nuclease HARBI1 n=1 Tax=Pristiophorus japonicus TaxID=55135 RepID=UPI00398E9ACF
MWGKEAIPSKGLQFSFLQFSDERRLRFRTEVLRELCIVLRDLQPQTHLRIALTMETKVTMAFNFYTMESFQSATADIGNVSQFSAHRCIRQVKICTVQKGPVHLLADEKRQTGGAAGRICPNDRLPEGAIDCTHVGLRAPHHHPEIFVNHKVFHSLNVQLVCDHQGRILAVDARYPGSSHDSFILRQTSVPAIFTGPNQECGWLVGDKGYPLSTWLLTPLWNPRTVPEHAYNDAHCATSCIIEKCIGIFKQRFRCLNRSGGTLQYSPQRVSIIIVVCCMLPNLVIMRGQPLEVESAVPPEEEDVQEEE